LGHPEEDMMNCRRGRAWVWRQRCSPQILQFQLLIMLLSILCCMLYN